ncbi:DUF3343 domain-containing protein [Clostridium botulinum C]|uniref:DUF3343 domain-containing protein n=3 Tax=Clostridium botulinum TaxID=1491 RepID=A0A9Q4TE05_CLOBO|nr:MULTISPECIES: DUF3343 domain-containing protein [Clostridium]EGO87704.1 hypothetical protein CBCST_10146 [Clostridium botulinum C str. Stockholm]EES90591.1 conserved hypothetical protein [Clostridium botulinum D str. 1873]MBO3441709.1 DUF3343 domain-containing protein [Clostridium haemolyticum]MCD3193963.1 DUF3343 domain-containing protein [Clostridium botulinum C]MCD3199408.1 DUF3343 domain-containing protein [Clostridium botulinum C]
MDNSCIAIFPSSSSSLHMFKVLKDNRLNVELIPTPCTLSSGCSRAIKFPSEYLDKIKKYIEDGELNVKGIYEKVYTSRTFYYKKVY